MDGDQHVSKVMVTGNGKAEIYMEVNGSKR